MHHDENPGQPRSDTRGDAQRENRREAAREHHRRAAKTQLDQAVVGIELTLISIIQGLALAVLAASATAPILQLEWQSWPYILAGLLVILIFWSRALLHTLSFIGWPLEFGHNFLYFAATLIEAVALTQVAEPMHWFALNAAYAAAVWLLYIWDLRVIRNHAGDFANPEEQALYADIVQDQRINIRWMMPAAAVFQSLSGWLIYRFPEAMLRDGWHLLLIGLALLFSLDYLRGGVRLLHRRRDWIVARAAQERAEG